jgi:DNA-binding XRE family transcriptional regulator
VKGLADEEAIDGEEVVEQTLEDDPALVGVLHGRQVGQPVGEDGITIPLERYRSGATARAVSTEFGVSLTKVKALTREHGGRRRDVAEPTSPHRTSRNIQAVYATGRPFRDLARPDDSGHDGVGCGARSVCAGQVRTVPHNGAAIRAFREIRGLSVAQLARRVEVTGGALSNIERENKRLSVTLANRIARELGVNVAALVWDRADAVWPLPTGAVGSSTSGADA